MHAATFDDLVNACLLGEAKSRLLYVFVRVAEMDPATRAAMGVADEDAAVVQVLFDAQQPVEPGLKFEQVRTAADAHSTDWTLCVVGVAQSADAAPPTEEQAQTLLAAMRDKILAGDVDDYAVIDRDGANVTAENAVAVQQAHTVN